MKGTYIEMKEEIAIVTGSNRGIGFACIKESAHLLNKIQVETVERPGIMEMST